MVLAIDCAKKQNKTKQKQKQKQKPKNQKKKKKKNLLLQKGRTHHAIIGTIQAIETPTFRCQ